MPLSKVELLHRSYKNNKQQHYGYLKIIGKKSRSQVQIIVLPILKPELSQCSMHILIKNKVGELKKYMTDRPMFP